MATVPRAPLFIEPPPKRPLGDYVIVNATILLASVVVATLPFNQKNWTPPPLKNAATFDSNWIPNTLAVNLAATVKPFKLTDWNAAPLKGAQTWDFQPPNALVRYPLPATKPFGLTDWNAAPLVNGRVWWDSSWIPNNLLRYPAPATKPFGLTDWNTPPLKNAQTWDSNWVPNNFANHLARTVKPFRHTDWQPAPLKNAQTWDFWNPNNFASHLARTIKPFGLTDWNAAPLKGAQTWDFQPPNTLVRYSLTATKPFSLMDWNAAPLKAEQQWNSNWIRNLAVGNGAPIVPPIESLPLPGSTVPFGGGTWTGKPQRKPAKTELAKPRSDTKFGGFKSTYVSLDTGTVYDGPVREKKPEELADQKPEIATPRLAIAMPKGPPAVQSGTVTTEQQSAEEAEAAEALAIFIAEML